ncbi:hypothetical protein PKHYL_28660 [Psychrobacter sp. KH172YL61]|nr:hypothetical protein PKHYL_28660 [Psychrobacter sp. KH172YL61]
MNVEDSRTLLVQPFDRTMVQAVDKAIREADLGLNPMTADVIRVPMPALTEDTRRDMQKLARGEAESSRVSIRNIRRDMMNDIKDLAKRKKSQKMMSAVLTMTSKKSLTSTLKLSIAASAKKKAI